MTQHLLRGRNSPTFRAHYIFLGATVSGDALFVECHTVKSTHVIVIFVFLFHAVPAALVGHLLRLPPDVQEALADADAGGRAAEEGQDDTRQQEEGIVGLSVRPCMPSIILGLEEGKTQGKQARWENRE